MNRDAARYQRALKRNLHCSAPVQKELLRQFHASLDAFLEETPSPTEAELTAAFGTPQEMAAVLTETIPQEEITRWNKRRRIIKVSKTAAVILLGLITAFLIFVIIKTSGPLTVVDESKLVDTIEYSDTATEGK